MKRVLVTGAGSFTARHLLPLLATHADAPELLATGMTPVRAQALVVPAAVGEMGRWGNLGGCMSGAEFRAANLANCDEAGAVVKWARPDTVFHLAGVSASASDQCFAVNLEGTRHLLEACARLDPPPVVLVVSSAAVYGLTAPEESPVSESTPLRPLTVYGASKAAAEILALTLHRRGVLRVAVARPFNLIGPGLRPGLAPSDFMAQARAIRAGRSAPEIRVGTLEPRRDFVDVRDAVRAYITIAATRSCWGQPWNIASGRPVAIGDLLTAILRATGVEVRLVRDAARLRAVEVPEQVGDASALARATGWSVRVTLEKSLGDMAAEV